MKNLIYILLFVCIQLQGQNIVYLTYQPQDNGVGIRFDHIGEKANKGIYASISRGNYYFDGGYIKNHIKVAMGGLFYWPETRNYLIAGMTYHKYGKRKLTPLINEKVFEPLSIEIGSAVTLGRIIVSCRTDIIKWEPSIDIGWKF